MPDKHGEQLAAWGKVVMLEMTGRVTGATIRTAVGFVDDADGSLLVAAGSPGASWALNLLAEPACHGTIGEQRRAYRAEELLRPRAGPRHHRADPQVRDAGREPWLRAGLPAAASGLTARASLTPPAADGSRATASRRGDYFRTPYVTTSRTFANSYRNPFTKPPVST